MPSAWGSSWSSYWGNAWGTISSGGGGGGGSGVSGMTARNVINRALRRIEVIAAGEEPSAEEARDALAELNMMMVSFPREGIAYEHTALALSDLMDMDDGLSMYVSNMLTERLAGEYGRQLTPRQQLEADEAKRALQAAYWTASTAALDPVVWRPTHTRFRSGY